MKTICLEEENNYSKINLPSQERCLELFKEFKVPKNILNHCLMVRKVALFLAGKIISAGEKINPELVDRSALLHDLFKMVSISDLGNSNFHGNNFSKEETKMWKSLREKYPRMHEHEVSYLFFKEDYPELALALRKISDPDQTERTMEEELVHYADARVLRDEIVSVSQRFDYLKKTYPRMKEDFWEREMRKVLDFEGWLMMKINLEPQKLAEAVEG